MIWRTRWLRWLLPLVLLIGTACGPCNLLTQEAGVPTPPRPVVVSTEAAERLESRIRRSLNGEPGQPFILRMSDSEVTSLAAIKLAEYGESPVRDLRIWFTEGKIYGAGTLVNVLPVETDFFVVASARVQDGQIAVEIEEVSAGTWPIPDSMLETISQTLNETVDEMQLDVQITDLEILEGQIIIKGVRK